MANPAAVLYEAWRVAKIKVNQYHPDWSELSDEEKDVWWTVVRAVCDGK